MTQSIALQRLAVVLDAYGANPDHWPDEERSGLLELSTHSKEATDLVARAEKLDALLDQYTVECNERFVDNILAGVPTTNLLDRVLAWLWPDQISQLWHPALVMSLPLLCGILMGSFWTPADNVDDWDEEGIYVMGMYNHEDQLQ